MCTSRLCHDAHNGGDRGSLIFLDQRRYFMKTKVAVSLLAILAVLFSGTALAQNKRMGTAAATELLIPVGARDIAMGGSSLATSKGTEAIFWNPAGLARLSHSAEGMFSSMAYLADIQVNYGAIGASVGDYGVIAFSIKTLSFGDIPLTTLEDPEGRTGRLFSPTYATVGMSYARTLTDAISAGGTFKVIAEHIDQVFSTGVAFDVGIQYAGLGGIPGLHLGVAVKNIGPQMQFDGPGLYGSATRADGERPEQKYKSEAAKYELPSLFEIGLGYQQSLQEDLKLDITSSFTNKNLGLDEYRVGGELSFAVEGFQLFGRAGLGYTPQAAVDEQHIFGSTFGIGIFYPAPGVDIVVDYAYRTVQFFDANTILSIKLSF